MPAAGAASGAVVHRFGDETDRALESRLGALPAQPGGRFLCAAVSAVA